MNESSLRAQLNKLDALRSSLHASFRFWDWIVVVGVALEFIVLAVEYWDEWRDFSRATIRLPEKPKTWLYAIGFLGIAMVAGGIAKELRIDNQIEGVETQIRQANEQLFGIVSKEAEHASTVSGQVEVRADLIQQRLDAASGQLSGLEVDVLAQGPRWRLLTKGEDAFIKALKPFPLQKVTVVTCGSGDVEREGLELALLNIFPKAGWNSPGYKRWDGCPNMLTGGNEIYFVAATDDSIEWAKLLPQTWLKPGCGRFNISHDAMNSLCDVLHKLGITTTAWREKPMSRDVGLQYARAFFGFNAPDGPAEWAYEEPGRIFLLIGPSAPMFGDRSKKTNKSAKPN
jgi:hypothetical protein